jgi:hypothetical protein
MVKKTNDQRFVDHSKTCLIFGNKNNSSNIQTGAEWDQKADVALHTKNS